MRRTTALFAIASVVAGPVIWAAPGALAEPVGPDPVPVPVPVPVPADAPAAAPAAGPAISLADLGAGGSITFYVTRDSALTSVTFPAPPGLVPASIKARLELPVNLRFGNLSVRQGERTISRQLLPTQDQAEVVIPLNGVEASGGWVSLNFAITALPLEGYCWDSRSPIRLADAAVNFAGTVRPPTNVADFLPPVLRKVTIAVPAKPSPGETAGAVQTAAAVAERNGQKPEVVVVRLPDGAPALPPPADPLERQIIVKEGPVRGLSLQGPALLISGPANELADQARLLGDESVQYAASTGAVSDALPEPVFENDTTTVEQMMGRTLSSEAAWPRVVVPIDQSRWGKPVDAVTVRLIGSYTPVPADFGGEVVVTIGGDSLENSPSAYLGGGPTVARWPADATGTIDRTMTIPNRLLKRSIGLDVVIRATGDPGNCGDYFPALLKIDGSTKITVQRANPPVPQGFQSLPQSLMTPRVRFGIGSDSFGDTVRAVQIMLGLQRSSAVPLLAEVTSLDEAIASTDPAVLIAADGWKDKPIALPFSVDQGKVDITGLDAAERSVTLTLDPAAGFGSLQTVFDGQRTVLIATSTGVPGQLDDLLRYLLAQPGRWSGLDGRAVIAVPGAEPVTIANPPGDYAETAEKPAGGESDRWFWWGVGGVAALAGLGALGILVRARRQTSG